MPTLKQPFWETNKTDKSHEFLSSVKMEDFVSLSNKALDQSRSISLFEIQKSLESFFPKKDAENLEGLPVNSLIEETKSKLSHSFRSLQNIVRRSHKNALSRKLWDLAGKDISQQIEETALNGKLYSEELGGAYLEHLKYAEEKAIKAWELQNQKNLDYVNRKIQVRPFLGHLRFLKKSWQRDAVRVGVPVVAGGALGGMVGSALFSWIGSLASKIGSGVMALAGGVGGLFFPELLQKLKMDEASRQARAEERQQILRTNYEPFNANFLSELRDQFKKYTAIAEEIKTNGEIRAKEFEKAIEARLNGANDKERAELFSHLLSVRNNPSETNLSLALRAFSPRGRFDKQFQVSFVEAVKRMDSLNRVTEIQNQLHHKAALDRTFIDSARRQQKLFTKSFEDTYRLEKILSNSSAVQNMVIAGKKPFAFLSPSDKKTPDSSQIFKQIRLDLATHGKENDLLRKFPNILSDSIGITPSLRLLICLQYLFVEAPHLLVDGSISSETKSHILSWIFQQNTSSQIENISKNIDIQNFINAYDKALFEGKDLLFKSRELDVIAKKDKGLGIKNIPEDLFFRYIQRSEAFSDDLIRLETLFKKAFGERDNEFSVGIKKIKNQNREILLFLTKLQKYQSEILKWEEEKKSLSEIDTKIENLKKELKEAEEKDKKDRKQAESSLQKIIMEIALLQREIDLYTKQKNSVLPQDIRDFYEKKIELESAKQSLQKILSSQNSVLEDLKNKLQKKEEEKQKIRERRPLRTDRDIEEYDKFFVESRTFFIEQEILNISSSYKNFGQGSKNSLYQQIKKNLFREFEKEMNENIKAELEKVDFFETLKKIDPKAGKLTVQYIDSAEVRDEYSLPSDFENKKTETFYISSHSNEKGIWLENSSGSTRMHIVRPFFENGKNDNFYANAVISQINPTNNDVSRTRAGIVTNVKLYL